MGLPGWRKSKKTTEEDYGGSEEAEVIEEDARDSVRWKQILGCDDREQPEEDKQSA